MAYNTKYIAGWKSLHQEGYLYIDEKDYTGGVTYPLTLIKGRNSIKWSFEDWQNHIIGLTLEFEVFNDKENYFDLLELMTATERQFRVRVETLSEILFTGFINTDSISQKYLNKKELRVVASSFLSKLKHLYPDSIDTLKNMTFIDIINEILVSTGGEYPIRINSSLFAKDDTLNQGQTLFNKNGFYTELFWENNVDRKNSLDVLSSILKSFDCFLYWKGNHWYIERFNDIWKTSINYVEYQPNQTYSPNELGETLGTEETNKTLAVGDKDVLPQDIFFKSDGLKLYMIGSDTDTIYQYTLATAWDVSTASYDSKSFNVGTQSTLPGGLAFSSDGTKLFVLDIDNNTVFQYILSTAWDISTASYATKSFDVTGQETTPSGLLFDYTGTLLYIVGIGDVIYQYELGTAWDISTASYTNRSLDVGTELNSSTGLFFDEFGDNIFVIGNNKNTIYKYHLETNRIIDSSNGVPIESYYVGDKDTGCQDLFIGDSGTKLYIIGTTNDTIYQFNLIIAWSLSNVNVVEGIARQINDVHDLQFIEQTQTLRITPGFKLLRLNLNDKILLNLAINDFSNYESWAPATVDDYPLPEIRQWLVYDDSDPYLAWFDAGDHNNISNAILRQFWKGGISGSMPNLTVNVNDIELYRGLYTKFRINVAPETKLNIKFKFGVPIDDASFSPKDYFDGDWLNYEFTGDWEDYEFLFYWYLRDGDGNRFIIYDETIDMWVSRALSGETAYSVLQEKIVTGDQMDADNNTLEVSIEIPLGDVRYEWDDDITGNRELTICIGTELIHRKHTLGYPNWPKVPAIVAYYGDVIITASSTDLGNVVEGTINTDYLNRKDIGLDLFDQPNLNYKNNVLRGDNLLAPTEEWTEDGAFYYTLVEWILINKFRLYNISRQKIIAQVFSPDILYIMQLFTESKQNGKKFVLTGLQHFLSEDEYEVTLMEYDNDSEISLEGTRFSVPTVVLVGEVYSITNNSATANGEVEETGGFPVTERGLCWGTNSTPTINDNYASIGTGLGQYSVGMSSLIPSTTYYVRAYARNSMGVAYSSNVFTFTTLAS